MRRTGLAVAIALALIDVGCGRNAVDIRHLIASCGLDCAADEVTVDRKSVV